MWGGNSSGTATEKDTVRAAPQMQAAKVEQLYLDLEQTAQQTQGTKPEGG